MSTSYYACTTREADCSVDAGCLLLCNVCMCALEVRFASAYKARAHMHIWSTLLWRSSMDFPPRLFLCLSTLRKKCEKYAKYANQVSTYQVALTRCALFSISMRVENKCAKRGMDRNSTSAGRVQAPSAKNTPEGKCRNTKLIGGRILT